VDLKGFFYPRNIVLFGVSASSGNLGSTILDNLERFSFKGSIYLVNTSYSEVKGRRTFKDVSEIETEVDLAVLLIPARAIPEVLDKCGRKGIHHVVIESGGFTESGEEKKALEEEILKIASRWGLTIMGPNCVGVINVDNGLIMPFFPITPEETKRGGFSFISQSGGVVHDTMITSFYEGIGINKFISMGNKLMVDENHLLEYLIDDPATGAIGLYLEDFVDGRRFMELVLSTRKPVMVLKSNIAPESNEIARFHTSSLAGDQRVVEAAMRQAGVLMVKTIKEMATCLKLLLLPELKGRRLAFVTRSGGHAVLCADTAYRYGFQLARLSDEFFEWLSKKPRANVIRATNPIDLGDVFDRELYAEIVDRVVKEPSVDGVVVAHTYPFDDDSTGMLARRANISSLESGKPVVFSITIPREGVFSIIKGDYPVFSDYDMAVRIMMEVLQRKTAREKGLLFKGKALKEKRRKVRKDTHSQGVMSPEEAFSFIRSHGLPVSDYEVVDSKEKAFEAAERIGYPVAVKTAMPHILHKTDASGVFLNVSGRDALDGVMERMKGSKYLIQAMERSGCEMIIGGREDGQFGKVILCGMGGIFTELYRDVSIRVVPVAREVAVEMIEGLTGSAILKGIRGQDPYDTDVLIDAILKVSLILDTHPEVKTIDINPLILYRKGEGAKIVDVKIEVF